MHFVETTQATGTLGVRRTLNVMSAGDEQATEENARAISPKHFYGIIFYHIIDSYLP